MHCKKNEEKRKGRETEKNWKGVTVNEKGNERMKEGVCMTFIT